MFIDLWQSKREDPTNTKAADYVIRKELGGRKPILIMWRGKAKKPTYHYSFNDIESLEKWLSKRVQERLEWLKKDAEDKEAGKEAIKNFKLDIQPGDIFYTSWGYEQTNIDFYKVLEVKNKTIIFQEIGYDKRESIENCFEQYLVTPDVNSEIGEPFKKIARVTYNSYSKTVGYHITLTSYADMYKWPGKPLRMTNYY